MFYFISLSRSHKDTETGAESFITLLPVILDLYLFIRMKQTTDFADNTDVSRDSRSCC